ncbi:hypothetical protein [Facilibium subflavum]|uniref:hypothetical protein n=1 Tax=Facilibium subflavum TaxID=2219058 RepID=UPI000E64FC08|nr:hypothetical protein [Facilibium subflavum]
MASPKKPDFEAYKENLLEIIEKKSTKEANQEKADKLKALQKQIRDFQVEASSGAGTYEQLHTLRNIYNNNDALSKGAKESINQLEQNQRQAIAQQLQDRFLTQELPKMFNSSKGTTNKELDGTYTITLPHDNKEEDNAFSFSLNKDGSVKLNSYTQNSSTILQAVSVVIRMKKDTFDYQFAAENIQDKLSDFSQDKDKKNKLEALFSNQQKDTKKEVSEVVDTLTNEETKALTQIVYDNTPRLKYTLNNNVKIDEGKENHITAVLKKARDQGVFVDREAFLNSISDNPTDKQRQKAEKVYDDIYKPDDKGMLKAMMEGFLGKVKSLQENKIAQKSSNKEEKQLLFSSADQKKNEQNINNP